MENRFALKHTAISIRYCRLSARLSVCDEVYCGARDWKLYHRVAKRALPIYLFGHYCCWMYRSATTQRKANYRNFRTWNSHGQLGYVTMAIPYAAVTRGTVIYLWLYE